MRCLFHSTLLRFVFCENLVSHYQVYMFYENLVLVVILLLYTIEILILFLSFISFGKYYGKHETAMFVLNGYVSRKLLEVQSGDCFFVSLHVIQFKILGVVLT